MKPFYNLYLLGYLALYALNYLFISNLEQFPAGETVGVFIIIGLGFSTIAWLFSRKAVALSAPVVPRHGEPWVLAILVVGVTLAIVAGNRIFPASWQASPPTAEIITLLRKILTIVVVPYLIYRFTYGSKLSEFGLSTEWWRVFSRRMVLIFVVMSSVVLLLNYFGGSGARPLREGLFSSRQILIGAPLLLLWNLAEVGLVEEFFFRGLLQSRLEAVLRSPWGGIVVSCVIFGLVHAPGMYLRGAGAVEGLGSSPSLLACIGYCLAVQSVAGFFFAIIWRYTRNLWLVMGIHAMMDLFPNLADFIRTWGI